MKTFQFTIKGFENAVLFLRIEAAMVAAQSKCTYPVSDMEIDIQSFTKDVEEAKKLITDYKIEEPTEPYVVRYFGIRDLGSESGTLDKVKERLRILGKARVMIKAEFNHDDAFKFTVNVEED